MMNFSLGSQTGMRRRWCWLDTQRFYPRLKLETRRNYPRESFAATNDDKQNSPRIRFAATNGSKSGNKLDSSRFLMYSMRPNACETDYTLPGCGPRARGQGDEVPEPARRRRSGRVREGIRPPGRG